jgi:hypothetical protein
MGITKIFDEKNHIVPEDEISFRALTKKTTMRLHLQNVDFFQ